MVEQRKRQATEARFPTKRLNPVAGTCEYAYAYATINLFPTKRLNPVAGTRRHGGVNC